MNVIDNKVKTELEQVLKNYPKEQRHSAIMSGLTILQKRNNGYLTTAIMDKLALYLKVSKMAVYEVATFYSMYEHKPVGKYKLAFCTNVSCMLRGADALVSYLENKLGIKVGEVTEDGLFSIKKVECLGSCAGAPMLQLNDEYHEHLNTKKLDKLVTELK